MKTTKRILLAAIVVCLTFLAAGPVRAVIETFDSYPTHTNAVKDPGISDMDIYRIYGDWGTNDQVIGTWEGDVNGPLTSAGIVNNGQDSYAFGTGSSPDPGPGQELGIMDFGMHDWGITSGVIADYLGVNGLDLHGGTLDVRALLNGDFSGQIQLGFVSDSEFNYGDGEGLQWVEFMGPMFAVTDSFDWYRGELNSFESDADGTLYGDSAGVKVLDVWVDLYTSSDLVNGAPAELNGLSTITGELQVDEIILVPEPATLLVLALGLIPALLKKRRA